MSKSQDNQAVSSAPQQNHSNPLEILYDNLLKALGHREQEVFRYLALVAPAIGGFIWLASVPPQKTGLFIVASLGLQLILVLGASYCIALSYHYRYMLAQIRKIEDALKISNHIIPFWKRTKTQSIKKARLGCMPWCSPPEVIKVFWYAFLMLIVLLSVGICLTKPVCLVICVTVVFGTLSLLFGWIVVPVLYGCKLQNVYKTKE